MYNYFVHVITCTKSQLVHDIYIIITILQLYQRESYPNICRLYINNTLVYIYIYINMNQHCWV